MTTKTYTLITGASGGIGLELAKEFAAHGHPLILVARSGDKLQQLKSEIEKSYPVRAEYLIQDLSKPSAARELFEGIRLKGWEVDVLVNNAAFGLYGYFADENLNEELEMIQLNVTTLTELTKLFLKPMRERKSGKILNVASTAAFQPGDP
jgi:short-subunit dehydrogenase